ncbi:hypothetical protein BDR04DRAFT_1106145 [Suillus decipiens]|nr:hypothetical protein BDR04DRAFT_1106145 [Suillus decipiens]
MTEERPVIPIAMATRTFEGYEDSVLGVSVFSDRRRIVTGSGDKTLRLWDLENGVVLKKMEGHCGIKRWAIHHKR